MPQVQGKKMLFWILQIALPAAMFLIPVTELFTVQMRLICHAVCHRGLCVGNHQPDLYSDALAHCLYCVGSL